jgi:hypothetical protein
MLKNKKFYVYVDYTKEEKSQPWLKVNAENQIDKKG